MAEESVSQVVSQVYWPGQIESPPQRAIDIIKLSPILSLNNFKIELDQNTERGLARQYDFP